MNADSRCPARIRPFPGVLVVQCERTHVIDDDRHAGVIRDYAYPGSQTVLTWFDDDRRSFSGEWVECPVSPCILPANHRGDHAT